MQGMKGLTKQDLLDLVEQNFADTPETEAIATFFYTSAGAYQPQQQCILFRKELENNW